jgi:uncharacterized protein
VDTHRADGAALAWNDPRFAACGRCATCAAEVQAHRDLLLVAGLRSSQRTRLVAAGVHTIDELAVREAPVPELSAGALAKLRAQAALQVAQQASGVVVADVFDPAGLAVLPPPDAGDIFFDFEGDPLWSDGDSETSGLEYLFGVVEVDGGTPVFRPFWAHDRAAEKRALQQFLDYVLARRQRFPAMHVYHYAGYEKAALLRLAARHGTGEQVVDDLLRDAALVDLYAVVRASLRVSQPSYSLKKLEPLYMGEELRDGDVQTAADSIVAYSDYCQLRENGQTTEADTLLAQIADYNEYDCRSTYRLRDWLLARAAEHGVVPATPSAMAEAPSEEDADAVVTRLHPYCGDGAERSPEQQAIALLAASVGYHQRELKPFWWAHFDRLSHPVDEWADGTDVLVVERAEVVSGWALSGRQRNPRRTLRLAGRLGVGSQLDAGDRVFSLYDAGSVPGGIDHDPGRRGVVTNAAVLRHGIDGGDLDELLVEECCPSGVDTWAQLPMAVTPGEPIRHANLHAAIVQLAETVADRLDDGEDAAKVLAGQPALQLLARYLPALGGHAALPAVVADDYTAALTAAVRALEGSWLAVQGPPGSGKTFIGAHVIARLVTDGWRVGVVAQSHKVVENLLCAVAEAGVPADRIAKKPQGDRTDPRWTPLRSDPAFAAFLAPGGCVLGGTAWDFTNRNRVVAECLDLLVIDEAGQFSLANTLAVSTAARNLLLLGDPQQLPQVSQGTHPEPCDRSALEWVAEGHRVLPAGRGYFLARTWRMHPALTGAVSRLAYDGPLLANAEVTGARSLDGIAPGVRVVEVQHAGNSVESAEEADAVLALVQDLVGRPWTDPRAAPVRRPLDASDILVVAPYNAQVALIHNRLAAAGLAEVPVGSVDRFQGQQAPVVIVSMTASAPEDVPRGMEFLLSRNRVNVAVSRGQWCAIIVRSPRLTDHLPATPAALARLGAFINLCRPHE